MVRFQVRFSKGSIESPDAPWFFPNKLHIVDPREAPLLAILRDRPLVEGLAPCGARTTPQHCNLRTCSSTSQLLVRYVLLAVVAIPRSVLYPAQVQKPKLRRASWFQLILKQYRLRCLSAQSKKYLLCRLTRAYASTTCQTRAEEGLGSMMSRRV
jgi:hypothetical protein